MADTKLTGLPEETTPASTDLLYIVTDNETTPTSKKVTYANIGADKVKYNTDDTVSGYLADKVVAGTGISLAEGTGGDADKLVITNASPAVAETDPVVGAINGLVFANGAGVISAKTIGIAEHNIIEIDNDSVAENDYAKFTSDGLIGRSYTEVKQDLDLEIGTDVAAQTHASQHAVGGADSVFPADPGADRYLKWNDTSNAIEWADVSGGGDMVLASIQSVTGLKTFDKDKIAMKGTSTGVNTISVANTSATSYTNTLPAKDGTFAMTSDIPAAGANTSLSNLSAVAINTSLLPGADVSVNLGTGDLRYKDAWIETISSGLTANDTLKLRGRDINTTAYVDVLTITSNDTVTADLNAITTIGGNAILYSGGALGTPSSGTLTNCTGLPVAGITSSTSTALGVGSIELGHASDTTLSRSAAGEVDIEGKQILTEDNTVTVTNKRMTSRIWSAASDATPDINSDDYDAVTITAQATAITDVNVTGTPTNFQKLIFRIKDNGTARAITWGSDFEAKGVALPTTTTKSKVLTVGFIWDSVTSKWGCVASVVEEA